MKRLAILSVLIFYTIASFGISVNYFYCCGMLKEISLSASHTTMCDPAGSKKCCKNKKIVVKFSTDQKAFENAVEKATFLSAILPAPVYNNVQSLTPISFIGDFISDTSPPPITNRQVLFCSFRI